MKSGMKGQGNSNTILGIFVSLAFLAMIATGFNGWYVDLNCPELGSWDTWNMPTSSSSTVSATNPTPQGFWGGNIPTTPQSTSNSKSVGGINPAGLTTTCSGALATSGILGIVTVAFASIIILFVVLHFIPALGMGST
jgi:hypothetical protein